MRVPVCRELRGHRRKADQVGPATDQPLTSLNSCQSVDVSAFVGSERYGPALERFAPGLHEDHRTSPIVHDSGLRDGWSGSGIGDEQPKLDGLADALDDLKIVDVISKPKQLSSILKEANHMRTCLKVK